MSLELAVIDIIEGKKDAPLLKKGLYFFSLLFQVGIKIHGLLYRFGILQQHAFKCPVISVGNIVAGGTGKTPFVKALLEQLSPLPGQVAILCRGYRSLQENKSRSLLISKGSGPLTTPNLCGDEAYWLADNTQALVIVGKNRKESGLLAIENGAQLLILEDGFQHRRLKRDMDLVLLDASDLFGKGYFLPRGYLRDSPSRLKEATVVVVTHLEKTHNKQEIEQKIRRYTKAPIIGFASTYQLETEREGKKVGAFCGIAKPAHFYEALASIGKEIVDTLTSQDHRIPSLEQLQSFATRCKDLGADCLICTEKDLVKMGDKGSLPLPVYSLKMSLTCVWNENTWKEIKESIHYRK